MKDRTLVEHEQAPEKLFTIGDARNVLLDLGVCKDDQEADLEIGRYAAKPDPIIPNGVYGAFWKVIDTASFTPGVKEAFQKKYGVPFNRTNLRDKAFGGFNIDPQKADLPAKE